MIPAPSPFLLRTFCVLRVEIPLNSVKLYEKQNSR